MEKNIFIVGARKSKDLIKYINSKPKYKLGFFVGIDEEFNRDEDTKNATIIKVDFSSRERVFESLKNYPDLKIDALIARYETYVIYKSWIAEFFHLPSLPEVSAIASRDKHIMREKFLKYNKSITPEFTKVKSFEDIEKFVENHKYPVMLKPTNLAKSLLISKNSNIEELKYNYEFMTSKINEMKLKHKFFDLDTDIIVEEYIEGSKHTVQGFADKDGNIFLTPVVDIINAEDIGFHDNFQYKRTLPSSLDQNNSTEIWNVAKEGMKALNLKNTAAHIDIILQKNGKAKIVEIGARMGGYRTRMYSLSFGMDLNQAEVQIQVDPSKVPVMLDKKKNLFTAVYEIFPEKEGEIIQFINIEKLENLEGLKYFSQVKKIGDMAGLSKNGFKAVLIIIINSIEKHEFENACSVVDSIKIITK